MIKTWGRPDNGRVVSVWEKGTNIEAAVKVDVAVMKTSLTPAKMCSTALEGGIMESLFALVETYQWAALEEARQLALKERHELAEEHQVT
ncbi:unnamed protein product [Caretta caretta]